MAAGFMGKLVALNPAMKDLFTSASAVILGSVPEGDMVHVVYRVSMGAESAGFSRVDVAPFKRHGDEWRALLTGDLQQMIQALRAQMDG